MIYSRPAAQFEALLSGAPTGLVGTLGVRIIDTPAGTTVLARTTAGIAEQPPGSGIYSVALTAPNVEGSYSVVWDTGGGSPVFSAEELVVSGAAQPPIAEPAGGAYAAVADVEALNTARAFTASSRPNTADVVGYLADTAAVLDGILVERGYVVPVSPVATAARQLLRHLNARGAYALAERAAAQSPHRDRAEEMWAEAQKMLHDGQLELAVASRDSSTSFARAPAGASAYFTRSMEW